MTRYVQVLDIRDRLALVSGRSRNWYNVTGDIISVFRAPTGLIGGRHPFITQPLIFTEWGACLQAGPADLAGPCDAGWVPHTFDPDTFWVNPLGGLDRIVSVDTPNWDPRLCCSRHEAIDTGWRTSECRHCAAPMIFHNMEWILDDRSSKFK